MKKLFFLTALVFTGVFFGRSTLMAEETIPLQIINESEASSGPTKVPGRPLFIMQEGNELTLPVLGDDYMFRLFDVNGVQVYSVPVTAGSTQLILPSTLSGSYELRLETDTYYYIGYIVL